MIFECNCSHVIRRLKTIQKSTLRLYATCIFVLVTTNFNVYNLLIPSNSVHAVKQYIRNGLYQYQNATNTSDNVHENNDEMVDTMYGLFSSMIALGYLLACLLAPFISEKVGRKNGLIVSAIGQLFATGMLTVAFAIGTVPMAFVARLLQGCSYSISGSLMHCFITEVPPPRHRSTIASLGLPIVALIQILVQFLGNPMVCGTLDGLPILASVVLIPAALTVIVMPFTHETPPRLLINGKDRSQYIKSLLFYRGAENPENSNSTEDEKIPLLPRNGQVGASQTDGSTSHYFKLLKSLMCKEFFIGFAAIQSTYQYSGCIVMISYSTSILEGSGFSYHIAESITSANPAVFLGFAIASIPLFKCVPRRQFMLIVISMQLCALVIFIIINTCTTYIEPNDFAKIIGAGCIVLYSATGQVMIPLAWLVTCELLSQNNRGPAVAAIMLVMGTCEMVSLVGYLVVASKVGYGVAFIPFVSFTLPCLLVLFKYFPETRELVLS